MTETNTLMSSEAEGRAWSEFSIYWGSQEARQHNHNYTHSNHWQITFLSYSGILFIATKELLNISKKIFRKNLYFERTNVYNVWMNLYIFKDKFTIFWVFKNMFFKQLFKPYSIFIIHCPLKIILCVYISIDSFLFKHWRNSWLLLPSMSFLIII